jgi:ATP-dependent helicase YprA (DUF1998 family)
MTVFELRDRLVGDYASYVESYVQIRDPRILHVVRDEIGRGLLWPEPLISLNPFFAPGGSVDELVADGTLHPRCASIFRVAKSAAQPEGQPLRLHRHQTEAIRVAATREPYVLTTGTGSGKSLAYIIPIVDHVLRTGSGRGVQAIVVYPMNALANSQRNELRKFLGDGRNGRPPVTFEVYTGQEKDAEKARILADPPDVLLTNYVMLELILTRLRERPLVEAARDLRFLVLDELHTYRGRQGADVSLLVRRVRERMGGRGLQCVGTSATLAGAGTWDQQRRDVARVAGQVFGTEVRPEHVIGETLRRVTAEAAADDPAFRAALAARVADPEGTAPAGFDAFVGDPLAAWIESTYGVHARDGRLVRAQPLAITGEDGGARRLARDTGEAEERCERAIQHALLAGYRHLDPQTEKPVFAFRLHQFISKGDTVYATLEPAAERWATVHRQHFKPGDRTRLLFPLMFCRECGQDYYSVWVPQAGAPGTRVFAPRDPGERLEEDDDRPGYLFVGRERTDDDADEDAFGERVPPGDRLRVAPSGAEAADGTPCVLLRSFRRCLSCGVEYAASQRSDFPKLGTLGTEGRSTATTILSLSTVRALREAAERDPELPVKLLSFTDNRQDASLQAGHFNDFVDVAVLRAALYRAVSQAGPDGLTHEELTHRVFSALDLPFQAYAVNPENQFQRSQTQRALREVLGYRLYRDLKRGWRITLPNLEQVGLLEIRYSSLDELCAHESIWADLHPTLAAASPAARREVAVTLLDLMRRELAIRVDYLDPVYQERVQQLSSQHLRAPWALEPEERLEDSVRLYPRPRQPRDGRGVFVSEKSRFALFVADRLSAGGRRMPLEDRKTVIADLLKALAHAGLVEAVEPPAPGRVAGYQVPATVMQWYAGEGAVAFHDAIRVPTAAAGGNRVNPFFLELYRAPAARALGFEAREHTAQVPYPKRQEREEDFKHGRLPVMYCSPTMELGVDIADLSVVSLRNVPPTPANYAQRSGRAGRSGQPALIFTYCSSLSPHDQFFFRRPRLMVSGQVTPPRLDLANEDLLRSHVHAVWLAESRLDLKSSVKDLLDLEDPALPLLPEIRATADGRDVRARALHAARAMLGTLLDEVRGSIWWREDWLESVVDEAGAALDRAVDRWRTLYRAASLQYRTQGALAVAAERSERERQEARRLRQEAEVQLNLLTLAEEGAQSDFYSYRYFASEGFLPGYNFPRLPLSAYVPGPRGGREGHEYLSRPRFLAISEFGPRSIVYHEGSRYVINRVIMPVRAGDEGEPLTRRLKRCEACGYLHPAAGEEGGADLCERCGAPLGVAMTNLFRLQNVSTRRRERINSDEEERQRMGYELRTGVRFAHARGRAASRGAVAVDAEGTALARITYGQTATLWRINLGWRRRQHRHVLGFVLDTERGYWQGSPALRAAGDVEDHLSQSTARVVPYVEDARNALLLEPAGPWDARTMASLQAALKNAIQVEYQLEDNELAAEPLPDPWTRNLLLFYESAEGGAGVLRRLVDEPGALARVARQALRLCHFEPDTGADLRHAEHAREECEAACYDCLLSYANQPDHERLDRKSIRDALLGLAGCRVQAQDEAPAPAAAADGPAGAWLRWVDARGCPLPTRGRGRIDPPGAEPDFFYDPLGIAVYVDDGGAPRDRETEPALEDLGWTVVRFGAPERWEADAARWPHLFGRTGR